MSIQYKEINQISVTASTVLGADLFEIEQAGESKQLSATILLGSGLKGVIVDGNISYLSANTLILRPVSYHFKNSTSDYWIQISTATIIASAMSGFPVSAAGAFICGDENGTISLETATGAATERATNNEFQLIGSGVGYDDINYGGYYINGKRILGHIFCVSSTSFYITKLGNCTSEVGQNSRGCWTRDCVDRVMTQYGALSQTTNASSGVIYYNDAVQLFPVVFSRIINCIVSDNGAGVGRYARAYGYTTSQFNGMVEAQSNGVAVPYSWIAKGTY